MLSIRVAARPVRATGLVAAALSGVLCGAGAPAFSQDSAPAGALSSESALAEVIVTAQRREQRLQDVGISVTAISGQDLQDLNVEKGADVARFVPSVKMNEFSAAAVVYNIRGVSQNDYGDQQEPPVAVYQDDSYSSTIVLASFPLFDIARVETLRGPQGTLFGRNATGGAIQFISNQPTANLDGYARAQYGRFNTVRVEGAVSSGITDTLSFRVAGEWSDGGNYYKAVIPGQHDLGGAQNRAFRAILKWTPTDKLAGWVTLRYLDAPHEYEAAMVTHEPACPNAHFQGEYLAPNQGCAFWGSPPGAIATGYRNDAINPQRGGNPWNTAHTYPDYVSRNVFGAQLHLEMRFDWATLTSITDYQHARKYYSEDTDATPDNAANYWASARLDQTSQEFRLAGEAGPHQWVLGAMGMYMDGHYGAAFDLPFLNYFPLTNFKERTASYAIFGQDEWQFARQLKLIGGLRFWDDRRTGWYHGVESASTGVDVTYGPDGFSYLQNGVPQAISGLTASPADARKNFSGVTARAELDYKPIDALLLYVSYNRGSKSGGYTFSSATPFSPSAVAPYFNGIQYKPETLQSIELGMKSTVARNTTLNVSAFYYDYKNYQAFVQYTVEQTILNLKAREVGLEAELTSRPMRGLTLQLNASTLSSRVRNVPLPDGVSLVDHDLPQAPHFSGGALARYEVPLGNGIGHVQADVQHLSHFCFTVLCAPVENEPAYTVANARVGYAIRGLSVDAYVDNIADRQYRVFGTDNSLTAAFTYSIFGPPRTYGVAVNYRFGGAP